MSWEPPLAPYPDRAQAFAPEQELSAYPASHTGHQHLAVTGERSDSEYYSVDPHGDGGSGYLSMDELQTRGPSGENAGYVNATFDQHNQYQHQHQQSWQPHAHRPSQHPYMKLQGIGGPDSVEESVDRSQTELTAQQTMQFDPYFFTRNPDPAPLIAQPENDLIGLSSLGNQMQNVRILDGEDYAGTPHQLPVPPIDLSDNPVELANNMPAQPAPWSAVGKRKSDPQTQPSDRMYAMGNEAASYQALDSSSDAFSFDSSWPSANVDSCSTVYSSHSMLEMTESSATITNAPPRQYMDPGLLHSSAETTEYRRSVLPYRPSVAGPAGRHGGSIGDDGASVHSEHVNFHTSEFEYRQSVPTTNQLRLSLSPQPSRRPRTKRPSTGPPSPLRQRDTITCNYPGCSATFTGKHRKGNLGRHRRNKHRGDNAKEFLCEEYGCRRVFMRDDALLKHYRKYHPERRNRSPVTRRP